MVGNAMIEMSVVEWSGTETPALGAILEREAAE